MHVETCLTVRTSPPVAVTISHSLARPAAAQHQAWRLYVLLLLLIFNDSFQTNYLNIHRQICRVGRTMPYTINPKLVFRSLNFLVPVTFGR